MNEIAKLPFSSSSSGGSSASKPTYLFLLPYYSGGADPRSQ